MNIFVPYCTESQIPQSISASFHVRPQKRALYIIFVAFQHKARDLYIIHQRIPAPCRVCCNPNWEFLAINICEYAHNIKQEEGFQFICVHLGLFVAWKKNLADFPPLCNSLGRLLSPGDSHADVWVKRAIGRIHGVFSMILINSVMLLVLRQERWTESVLRTTDSFFPKAKKCHFHQLFPYTKAQNGFPEVCIWFCAAFTSLLNLFCTQIQLP